MATRDDVPVNSVRQNNKQNVKSRGESAFDEKMRLVVDCDHVAAPTKRHNELAPAHIV